MILKKITLKFGSKVIMPRSGLVLLGMLVSVFGNAQVQNNGSLSIGNGVTAYIASGNLTLGFGSVVTTQFNSLNATGKLSLSSGSEVFQALPERGIEGLLEGRNLSYFKYPVRTAFRMAPVAVADASVPTSVVVVENTGLYFPVTNLDNSVSSVSASNFWYIKGGSAKITLSWDTLLGYGLIGITNNLSDLTIVGYANGEWKQIPSEIDLDQSIYNIPSNLSSGSITSYAIDLSQYEAFALGTKGSCQPLVASSGVTKTWNGNTWSPSPPTLADPVVIDAPYNQGFDCNSLVLNADVLLNGTASIEIVNGASGPGRVIMSTNASVIQRASGASAPNIVLTKETGYKRKSNFIFWGTPIEGDFFSQFSNAKAVTGTLTGALDNPNKFVSGVSTTNGGGWKPATSISTGIGIGFGVKAQPPFVNATVQDNIKVTFDGVANNGDVTVPINHFGTFPMSGLNYNFLANPYPSAIDAVKFVKDNPDIDGTLYLWHSVSQPGLLNYPASDYLIFNLSGVVETSNFPAGFTGKIDSGQGFKVFALQPGSATFTNCMRVKTNTALMYRGGDGDSDEVVADSYKINLTGNEGIFSQILMSYSEKGTLGYDRMYDALRNSANAVKFYSIMEEDQRKLAINARPVFDTSDVVQLGVSKQGNAPETFTFSIDQTKGVFANGQSVFLHDKVSGTYHNFSDGPFSFTTNTAALNDRFEVVYQASTLPTDEFEQTKVIASINNNLFSITSKIGMKQISIFDMTGRLVAQYFPKGNLTLNADFSYAKAFYVARIELDNGIIATEKLIAR